MSAYASDRLVITHGNRTAVFLRTDAGWTPDWFYEDDRPMLRFKDHEWLSIGQVHPTHADTAEETAAGVVFRGVAHYGTTPVPWSVSVAPDPHSDGFCVECAFTPQASIELLEAYTTFETPYEYDGAETVTTVIGMNPVTRWQGATRLTPPIWDNPAWVYSRANVARITGPCQTPYLCQAITAAGTVPDRHITVIGDWNVCRVHDVYANPTRIAPQSPPGGWGRGAETTGYKYIVGALNWSSAYAKDPNVLFAGGKAHRQRVIVAFSTPLPGDTMDAMLLQAWQRAARFDLPADGRVEAYERTVARGVTWQTAVRWLRDVFTSEETTAGLYKPGAGIRTYAEGTRPKASADYGWNWWGQWAGLLHYRARLTGDDALAAACATNDDHYAAWLASITPGIRRQGIGAGVTVLPSIWWVHGGGHGTPLHAAMQAVLARTLERSAEENGQTRSMDYGFQASVAEALLLGAEAYDEAAMRTQALVLLGEIADRLDGNFWEFNCGKTGSLIHGGQIRSLGHGHAVMANLLAYRQTGEGHYLALARRFARYLLAVSYATHNGSHDVDFDFRGWCNGSNAGRDQIAEYPPWETQNGLLCLSALLGETEVEEGFYDALWYIGRTGLAQFPAARTLKRVLDEASGVHYVPRATIASERDFYDTLPYLAYENPHDQTMLASYQGSDCVVGEFVYGGGLASAADSRLGVLVPRAATLDLRECSERLLHLWNPTPQPIDTTLTVRWPDGTTSAQAVEVPSREVVRLTIVR